MSSHKNDDGRYAYAGLDRVLHEKARLGIVTSLPCASLPHSRAARYHRAFGAYCYLPPALRAVTPLPFSLQGRLRRHRYLPDPIVTCDASQVTMGSGR